MRRFTFFVLLAATTACQSMYGAKTEPLPKVRKVPHQAFPDLDPVISYIDTCATNFRGDPTTVSIDHSRSVELLITGDTSIQRAVKIAEPAARAKAVSLGIDHYSKALGKDPYNAEATLKLALAYDKVFRRGCALKLLARIAVLENHPKFRISARRIVESVTDNAEWFKAYRKDAIAVINGAVPSR